MKKVIILISLSIIFGFMMTGCGKEGEVLVSFSEENKDNSVDEEEPEEQPESLPEEETEESLTDTGEEGYEEVEEDKEEDEDIDEDEYISDREEDEIRLPDSDYYKAVYAPVVSEITGVLRDGYVTGRKYEYVTDVYFEWSELYDKEYLPAEIGFVIADITGDWVPELIIGVNDSYDDVNFYTSVYCIFTEKDGKPFAVFRYGTKDDIECSTVYKWLGDGHLLYMKQISTTDAAFGDFHLSRDGMEIIWDDFYFSDEKDDGETGFYNNKIGVCNINESEEIKTTRDEFYEKRDKYESLSRMLRIIPIQNYEYGSVDNRGDEVEVKDRDSISNELQGNWLFPNGASLYIGYNNDWHVTDSKNWYLGGEFKEETENGIVKIELYSEYMDKDNERVAQGILHYDNTGHPVIDIEFKKGISRYTNEKMTLQKSPDLVF